MVVFWSVFQCWIFHMRVRMVVSKVMIYQQRYVVSKILPLSFTPALSQQNRQGVTTISKRQFQTRLQVKWIYCIASFGIHMFLVYLVTTSLYTSPVHYSSSYHGDPATTYCFSVLSCFSESSSRFNVSATICRGVDPIHWPSAMSASSVFTYHHP